MENALRAKECDIVIKCKGTDLGMHHGEKPDDLRVPRYHHACGLLTWLKQVPAKRRIAAVNTAPNAAGLGGKWKTPAMNVAEVPRMARFKGNGTTLLGGAAAPDARFCRDFLALNGRDFSCAGRAGGAYKDMRITF
jgi:hypothetical protein